MNTVVLVGESPVLHLQENLSSLGHFCKRHSCVETKGTPVKLMKKLKDPATSYLGWEGGLHFAMLGGARVVKNYSRCISQLAQYNL